MNCDFRAYEVCTNFRWGLLQRGRQTGVEPLNLVIIHIMQHHLSDILRCTAVCNMYYCESSYQLSNDTKRDDLESIIMFESFIGHVCRTVC